MTVEEENYAGREIRQAGVQPNVRSDRHRSVGRWRDGVCSPPVVKLPPDDIRQFYQTQTHAV